MKVHHVITCLGRGGAENHLVDLLPRLKEAGYDVSVSYLKTVPYWKQRLEAQGIKVHDLGMRFYGDPRAAWRLLRLCLRQRFDVLHAHLPGAELYAALIRVVMRRRFSLVCTRHNDEPFGAGPLMNQLERWVGRTSSHVIAISGAVRDGFISRGTVRTERCSVIHYGLDTRPFDEIAPDRIEQMRQAWGVAPGAVIFGCVGRLVPQKDHETVLRAYAEFQNLAAGSSRLVLIGAGPLEPQLRRVARELKIEENITWAGFVEDMPCVMKTIDVLVLLSRYEGFGLVLLEAGAAQKPVIGTAVSAIPEIVVDGQTGLLVPVGDYHGAARAMVAMLDRQRRKTMGAAAYVRVASRFKPSDPAVATTRVYEQVANNGGG